MIPEIRPVVCLLTDFGHKDNYVGVMKGVLLKEFPDVHIVDITHDVPPQNIRFGAFQLLSSYPYFPGGTLFLAVVDPGVGSNRKILYAKAGDRHFIGPDNGIYSWVFEKDKPSLLLDISGFREGSKISSTFHGRDIMAPFASLVLKGENPEAYGKPIKTWTRLSFPEVRKSGSHWEGEVLAVDSFGNIVTNFSSSELTPLADKAKLWFEWKGQESSLRGLAHSYSDVGEGKLLAIAGSSDFVEISVRNGSAAEKTTLKEGEKISVHFPV